MSIEIKRTFALIIKEFYSILQDPKSRLIILAPPVLQLLIFAHSATMEVRNIDVCILNKDKSQSSYNLIRKFENSKYFKQIFYTDNENTLKKLITNQKVQMGLVINNDFTKKLKSKAKTSDIQGIYDGRQTNIASVLIGYTETIINEFLYENYKIKPAIDIEIRNFYNPNLKFIWYTVISLIAIISTTTGLVLTALSIAKEREEGSYDEIIISPLTPIEILIGKIVPSLIVSIFSSSFMLFCAIVFFKIPYLGSLFLFYLSTIIFMLSILGIGIYISSLSKTQQVAIFLSFTFIMPSIIMSGYVSPVENMPYFFRILTYLNPVRFYLVIIKGLFLKNMDILAVSQNLFYILLIAILTLTLASKRFKRI